MRYLPATGAVAAAEGVWADELHLSVGILEHLDAIARLLYGQSGKRPPWKPLHVPRPGEAERKRSATADRMAALLERSEVIDGGAAERR